MSSDLASSEEPDSPEAAPASPDYVPSHEEPEQAPLSLDYVPGPEYPEYLAPSDEEEDLEEDSEDGPVDYPADGGDGDDDESSDNDEEEEASEEKEEASEEEHLAPTDSVVAPVVDYVPSSEETEPFETDEYAATPPSPPAYRTTARISIRPEAPMHFPSEEEVERLLALPPPPPSPLIPLSPPSAEECLARCLAAPALPSSQLPIVHHPYGRPNHVRAPSGFKAAIGRLRASSPSIYHPLHPSPPLPPPPSSLHITPPVDRREDIPEAELPPRKRLCLTALTSRYEVGESSTAAPRPTRGHRADYGFIGTMDAEIKRQRAEEEQDTHDICAVIEDTQDRFHHYKDSCQRHWDRFRHFRLEIRLMQMIPRALVVLPRLVLVVCEAFGWNLWKLSKDMRFGAGVTILRMLKLGRVASETVGFCGDRVVDRLLDSRNRAGPTESGDSCEGAARLSSLSRRSFDVIVGMNWLSKRKFVIVCHEKVVRIPIKEGGILRVHGERTLGAAKALMNAKIDEPKLSDIFVSKEEHEVHLKLVLESLRKEKLYAKFSKYNSKEWNSSGDQLRLRWMIYLVVLADVIESIRDAIGFEYCLASLSGGQVPVRIGFRLPEDLNSVHDTFHVSNLKKCLADANLHVLLNEIKIDKTLRFVEEPVEIMDRGVKMHVYNKQQFLIEDEAAASHHLWFMMIIVFLVSSSNLVTTTKRKDLVIPVLCQTKVSAARVKRSFVLMLLASKVFNAAYSRSYALSWKPYQGDSLNLPDHRMRRRCCNLIPAKSDSKTTCSYSSFQSQSFNKKTVDSKLPHHQRSLKSNKNRLLGKIVSRMTMYKSNKNVTKYEHAGQEHKMIKKVKSR
ncbi:hypothetical protein Tco_0304291 [Tanacetum coccineum]